METTSIEQFYHEINATISKEIAREIGHFNVFSYAELAVTLKEKPIMPYNKRTYYKISLITGKNTAEYADKVIEIEESALVFATPKVPYHWIPKDERQQGYFCVFTDDFLARNKSGVILDDLPIFQPGGLPIFQISPKQRLEIERIFEKMNKELSSDYAYKYDLLRNYVLEIIHYGQKLQPKSISNPSHNAATRITSLFIELLERQFPVESPMQRLQLRTANDFAERLAVHVNHLNKLLKDNTGKTTTQVISARITQEAKILLKQTNWNISEIAYSLGFEEIAHFSNFFKKQTKLSPNNFRSLPL
ncbi:AraC family transcriptional regulator [Sphingobacterium sp. DR205]|uniref:helix-turn-helix domain-containing protein n=1 Tax=Sphingobacterium sp. DR205 TaxID=2713573 RepID=UPI0013E4F95A|nr:AraC family transcriptional regulator [Sphingobacterium sp. DR205]QIH35696.1 helix-turn-helix transcriptional regulator [Sphingobacterium sp. DR205]